eukprot:scaffold10473_cov56-Skeletonema_dohrnii-CCMP3373.AAC.1
MPIFEIFGDGRGGSMYGAFFETDILILRQEAAPTIKAQPLKASSSKKNDNGRYSSPSGPMKAMSGVLESSHQALSIRRIISLIGRPFANHLGQKGG